MHGNSLQLPNDGSPLNKEWIQRRLESSMSEKTKLVTEKKMLNNKVLKNKVIFLPVALLCQSSLHLLCNLFI